MNPIPAAGTLPWRIWRGRLEVALVHRPRYDDWSFAKGKLDPGEEYAVAAARETWEETGLRVRLGLPLPPARYAMVAGGAPAEKVVAYWSASVTGGKGLLENEIDEVRWVTPPEAHLLLDYARDRDQLRALVRAHQEDRLDTWTLVLLRHAHAVSRSDFTGSDDRRRPLDAAGAARAQDLRPLLAAYGITRVVTSPSLRCLHTISPYAADHQIRVRTKVGLSEEGFALRPERAVRHLQRLLERGEPAVLCTHGPVLPSLIAILQGHLELDQSGSVDLVEALEEARVDRLAKGEALICHLHGRGPGAALVALERQQP